MKKLTVLCAFLLSTISVPLFADGIRIPETSISFVPPAGFTPLTQEEIDIKFPNKNGPKYVLGNERRTTTVAYDLKPVPLTTELLRANLEAMAANIARAVPGAAWIEKKMITLGGIEWAYLEMTSTAVDADIHNIILMGPWQGKLVVFNFNATKAEFAELETVLRASLQSIVVGKS